MVIRSHRIILLFLATLCTAVFSSAASARMTVMSDSELSEITGHGFANITLAYDDITGYDITRIDINQTVSMFTEMDSMKMGYYDNIGDGTGYGWDQNWTTVSFGSASQDLVMDGFFLRAEFQDIDDPVNRQLKTVTIGFTDVTGDITANFESLSLAGAAPRQAVGQNTLNFLNSPLAIKFIMDGSERGIWLDLSAQPVP